MTLPLLLEGKAYKSLLLIKIITAMAQAHHRQYLTVAASSQEPTMNLSQQVDIPGIIIT